MPDTDQLEIVTEQPADAAVQPLKEPPAVTPSDNCDSVEEGVAALYAMVDALKKRLEEFSGNYAASRNLKNDIDGFLFTVAGFLQEIGLIGVLIEDSGLKNENDLERELEGYEEGARRAVALAIDELLNGPDLSLRVRFEEISRRLRTGEIGFHFGNRDPYGFLRDSSLQIAASIR